MDNKIDKLWIVYDERARLGSTMDASVLVSCQSLKEARGYARNDWKGCPIFEYDVVNKQLVNERLIE